MKLAILSILGFLMILLKRDSAIDGFFSSNYIGSHPKFIGEFGLEIMEPMSQRLFCLALLMNS
jgi:hypothetical protein